MRARRLLRRLTGPSRDGARAGGEPPDHPLDPARRGVVVVLRGRGRDGHPRGAGLAADPAVSALLSGSGWASACGNCWAQTGVCTTALSQARLAVIGAAASTDDWIARRRCARSPAAATS